MSVGARCGLHDGPLHVTPVWHSLTHTQKEGVLHVSFRYLARRVLSPVLLGLLGVAATVVPATASAANGSGAADHVYINDDTAGANTIAVFERHANGALTPTVGSLHPGAHRV